MTERFVSWNLEEIVPGEPLPASFYLYLDHRFIRYCSRGDVLDRATYDRMSLKKVAWLFVHQGDLKAMEAWIAGRKNLSQKDLPISKELVKAREDAQRSMMDIFHANHANEIVAKTLKTSENLVTELMKFPFAAKPLTQLQTYSRGTVDHSVNVSVLAVFLAMNMGYAHVLILRHIAAGALLHDIGKSQIELAEGDTDDDIAEKMRKHPEVSAALLREDDAISKEVKMIVAQHHECHDGSGFPRGMRGKEIYDLAKIVAIANTFDELVSEGSGPLDDRQKHAISELEGPLAHKFDPVKLQKALKVLSLGV